MTLPIQHTRPVGTTEMLAVLALFPKCTTCGGQMSLVDPLEPDPTHAFRLRHVGPCQVTVA
jgi:hypothetical protein